MFTGIITDIGHITGLEGQSDKRVIIATRYDPASIALGASIACSGICLTVVDKGGQSGDAWFAVDVSGETQSRTAQGQWAVGRKLNLERALKVGDELGGHIVTGHVDGLGHVASFAQEGESWRMVIHAPHSLAPYIAPKGSITLDGVSLTVNAVEDLADGVAAFGINIIPHTLQHTCFAFTKEGDAVNIEIDVLARYLNRMQARLGAGQ